MKLGLLAAALRGSGQMGGGGGGADQIISKINCVPGFNKIQDKLSLANNEMHVKTMITLFPFFRYVRSLSL